MAENLRAFKEAMQGAERRRATEDKSRHEERPSDQVRSAIEAAQARYHGYIATINGMRDHDIERAMTGR